MATLGDLIVEQFTEISDDVAALENEPSSQRKRTQRHEKLEELLGRGYSCLDLPVDAYRDVYFQIRSLTTQLNEAPLRQLKEELESEHERRLRTARENAAVVSNTTNIINALASAAAGVLCYGKLSMVSTVALGVSGYLYCRDTVVNKGMRLFTWQKLTAIGLGCVPSLEFLAHYAVTEEPIFLRAASAAFFDLTARSAFVGLLLPWGALQGMQYVRGMKERRAAYDALHGLSKPLRTKMRRIGLVLDEMSAIQSLEQLAEDEHTAAIAQFEEACVQYLEGKSGKDSVIVQRKHLETLATTPSIATVMFPAARVQEAGPVPLSVSARPELVHPDTYRLVRETGVDHQTAKRIARSVTPEDAEVVMRALRGAVQDDAPALFCANPDLFFLRSQERTDYLSALHRILGKIRTRFDIAVPADYQISSNPSSFAAMDGLSHLDHALCDTSLENGGRGGETLLHSLRSEGYANIELLHAMLVKGFGLGTSTPRIGMAYRHIRHIRHHIIHDPHVDSRDMRYFDDVLGRLIRDGVVLEDKVYKTGEGGRFKGCYSVTPHLSGIRKQHLRDYVRFCLYGRNRAAN